jgi:hypothetical protein
MEYLIGVILTLAVAAFAAVIGFDHWRVVAALFGHGAFDFVPHFFIDNPGVPQWWPGFCLASDVVFGAWLAVLVTRQRQVVRGSTM